MKRLVLFIATAFCSASLLAQHKTDTIYYDSGWNVVDDSKSAEYFRIAEEPRAPGRSAPYKDYYITGELQSEGRYLSIHKSDDSKSVFEGECVNYYKDGSVRYKRTYTNGKLNGRASIFEPEGLVILDCCFLEGELHGLYTKFSEDGTYTQAEFCYGEMKDDRFIISDRNGCMILMDNKTNTIVWESPDVTERKIVERAGHQWQTYNKNGIVMAAKNHETVDNGKWHCTDIIMINKSLVTFEFDPSIHVSAYSVNKKGKRTDLEVLPCDTYLKEVNKAHLWPEDLSTEMDKSGPDMDSATFDFEETVEFQNEVLSRHGIAEFSDRIYEDDEMRKIDYLTPQKMYPGDAIYGHIHIRRVKGEEVFVTVTIDGAQYVYNWEMD